MLVPDAAVKCYIWITHLYVHSNDISLLKCLHSLGGAHLTYFGPDIQHRLRGSEAGVVEVVIDDWGLCQSDEVVESSRSFRLP